MYVEGVAPAERVAVRVVAGAAPSSGRGGGRAPGLRAPRAPAGRAPRAPARVRGVRAQVTPHAHTVAPHAHTHTTPLLMTRRDTSVIGPAIASAYSVNADDSVC